MQRLDEGDHADRLALGCWHARQQHFGVDVEVAELDQAQSRLASVVEQRGHFIFGVDQAGEAEQVDRGVDASVAGLLQRALDVVEGVADRAVVGVVRLADGGDGAGAQAVESGVVEALQRAGIAGVGVDVDRAAGGALADGPDRALDAAAPGSAARPRSPARS